MGIEREVERERGSKLGRKEKDEMSGIFAVAQAGGNNTEAIRENGGIISRRCIISADSSIMHNLHRFNNTPCALILSQLQSVCWLVGLHLYTGMNRRSL